MISWDKQLEYEASYAENLSWKLDVKILFYVFRILFNRNKNSYGSFVRKPLNVERDKNAEGASDSMINKSIINKLTVKYNTPFYIFEQRL